MLTERVQPWLLPHLGGLERNQFIFVPLFRSLQATLIPSLDEQLSHLFPLVTITKLARPDACKCFRCSVCCLTPSFFHSSFERFIPALNGSGSREPGSPSGLAPALA